MTPAVIKRQRCVGGTSLAHWYPCDIRGSRRNDAPHAKWLHRASEGLSSKDACAEHVLLRDDSWCAKSAEWPRPIASTLEPSIEGMVGSFVVFVVARMATIKVKVTSNLSIF